MAMSALIKSLEDIMRKDAGLNGDAQYIEQITWLLFLKAFDAKEMEWEFRPDYHGVIPKGLRWRDWAADKEGVTGDALISFVDTLFSKLKKLDTSDGDMRKYVVRNVFEDINNYMKSGVYLRQLVNRINEKVDFIDAYGLGKWGEGHSLIYKDPTKNSEVMQWITTLYARTFTEVPLVINYHRLIGEPSANGWGPVSEVSERLLRQAIANGYSLRHDAFGMNGYYQQWEKEFAAEWNFKRPIIMEGGWITAAHHRYWTDPSGEYREGHSEDVRKGEFKAAQEARVNMMDLRVNDEVRSWFGQEFELVKRFVAEGGYRLYPVWIKAPSKASGSIKLEYEWKNMGWGYCPVNIPQWDWRYTVGFALLDEAGQPVQKWASDDTDLATWLKESVNRYSQTLALDDVPAGTYTLATALVDRRNALDPGLDVAVDPSLKVNGWVKVRQIEIK